MLYVAMTRARHQLDLIAPLKFYVTQQPRMGDGHVYGARSRFLTAQVMACLDCAVWPERLADDAGADATRAPVRIDVAARLRDFWA